MASIFKLFKRTPTITMADHVRIVTSKIAEARKPLLAEIAAAETELARWRQHGQLRDPKTGRLIPRADTAAHARRKAAKGVANG